MRDPDIFVLYAVIWEIMPALVVVRDLVPCVVKRRTKRHGVSINLYKYCTL